MGNDDDDEDPFKRKSKIPKTPPQSDNPLIDELKVETTDVEKEALAKKIYEEKRKSLLGLDDDSSNNVSGTIPKVNFCVECALDTKDYIHIICEKCNKTSHIECVKIERFSDKGNYRCTKCSVKRPANEKIYASLKSELIFFIANHEVDKANPINYGGFVHESCEINEWPTDDDIDVLSYQINTDKCGSLICISCNKIVDNDKALVCKGCLTLYHPECCNDSEGNEKHCPMCRLSIAKKIKMSESHTMLDNKRPMRKRETKPSIPQKVDDCKKEEKRTSIKTHVNHSDSESSDEESESENSRPRLGNSSNASSSQINESKKLRDELHRMQLNQILHKNLPPLFEFSQWESFYNAFEETKQYFSASQNVERIKNAIKCATVKTWGKNRLFELETYDERIQYINKTYNLPTVILRSELQKLTKRKRIASHERLKLAEFINDVEDFCVLQTKKGTEASRKDENMIRAIIEILPREVGESYVNYVHNKNQVLCIENLNKFLQKKMFGLIYNNPEILEIESTASTSKSNENEHNTNKQKGRHGSFNNNTASIVGCGLCDDKRHTIFNCRQAWKLSGRELSKKLRDKRICLVCAQEPFSGKDHKCSKPSNKFCSQDRHKNNKHYEILCALREPSNSQNQTREPNYENHNTNRNNSSSRGRGRGNGRSGQNNSRQNFAQSFLNQNNSNDNVVPQNSHESGVNSVAHNDYNQNNNTNNSQTVMNTQQSNTTRRYCTFLGSFFNMNKSEPTQWKTSETLLPVILIKIGQQKIPVSFLLDTGSAISMIETYVADSLEEQGQTLPIRLNWSGDVNYYSRSDPNSRVISVKAEAFNKNENKRTMHFHTFKNLSLAPQTLDVDEIKMRYMYLRSLNLGDYKNIHGVIGQDQVNLFKVNKQFSSPDGNEDCYLGYETPMGDYVSGTRFSIASLYMRLMDRTQKNNAVNMHAPNYMHQNDSVDLKELEMLEKRLMGDEYFEEPPINDRVNADEQYATSILENEMYKDENGKFVSPLIFKDENPNLPAFESFCAAKKRHFTLMAMLTKHDKIEEVNDEIKKMLNKGYCEKVPQHELRSYDMTYYLPIFCISPPNKRTRIIWDGRAECSAGKSLNSFLLPGPNLYNNILQIYLNMRSEDILIVGDLEEMFHQIIIKPKHRDALRFLWTDKNKKEPEIYRMTRLVFGVNCAPFIAQFAVKLTAKNIKSTHPQIAKILSRDIYMDDIVTTSKNLLEGQEFVVTLKICLSDSGFNLVKLKSSHPAVFDKLKSLLSIEELAHEKLFPEGNMHRVLGYLNDFNDDTFGLGIRYEKFENFLNENIYPSKRDVLVLTRSIYDPLGLFAFVTSKFKYIYHLACNEKLDWEDPIPHEIFKLWKQALPWLSQCCNIKIPRCYMKNDNESHIKQLWAFSDASDHAECVAIYYRLITLDRKQVNVTLVMGKDFIIPKNLKRTIPELELDAATRAIMLLKDVVNLHTKVKFDEIYLAVDNTSVFNWLIYGIEKPTVYVRNRFKKISEANQNVTFKWVPTEFQAADYGTKFSALPDLHANNEWFFPNLFRLAEEDWISDQFLRKSENTLMTTNTMNVIDWEKFSSLNRLIEIVRRTGKNLVIMLKENRLRKWRERNDDLKVSHKITRRMEWSGNLDEPTFRFLVISIVGMMNNRPLCPVQIQGTTSFLTPNSFIMNRENNAMCPPVNPPEKYDQLWTTYLRIQKILWEHFVDHCVPQWITREKWLKPTKNFDIGEIVLTLDHRKMNEWRLARVIEIEKGSNNQVRKLTLMLGKRPQNAIPKFNGKNFEAFAKALYEKGKCYKVTRAAAHVIKLDLYCEESIPNVETLEELIED